ncbi:MAG: hypothetical protein IJT49_10040 [Clostridia bacterium]|nr:hypothetical protein [Clostridia bacterium]
MLNNSSKSNFIKRNAVKAITLALSFVFVFSVITAFIINAGMSVKAEEIAREYNIRSAADLKEYSRQYKLGYRNKNDVLNISINEGDVVSDDGFISIGTIMQNGVSSPYPFSGTINVPTAGVDVFHLFDCPLFDYVSTDMKITGAGTIKIMREKLPETPAEGALTHGALFANHVVAGTSAANWSISLLALTGNGTQSESFEGLIGDIENNANVTITFTNEAPINVSGEGNIGLICGALGEGSTLNVTTSGSGANISVTSTGGHAGGLVGEMKSGSTLKFNSANNSKVTSVTSGASKYAGGVIGYADNITLQYGSGITDYAVSGTVIGGMGAGGVFGYYKNTSSPATFTLEDTFAIASGMSISSNASSGYTGGVFGLLENTGASLTFDGNDESINVNLNQGTYRGGICGGFQTNALTNTFEVYDTNTTVNASGDYSAGLVGALTNNTAAYVNIHDVICMSNNASLGAGIIGTVGNKGSFVDMTGNITVSCASDCKIDAGLISNMTQGVLRMSGVFNLSGFVNKDAASGYLVKERGRALVYALGDGKGTNNGWTFKRNTGISIDDIHSWGEVVRMDGTILKESDLVTVDMDAHTVTVAGAVETMSTVTDFTKTALNISLNTENNTGTGALQFNSSNASSTLLGSSSTLKLGADISLAGTGITGLTRDNTRDNVDIGVLFKGTFDGQNHTLTFATGENYGLKEDGTALPAGSTQGNIHQHTYNGLFAKTSGATIQNVTLSGNFYINQTTGDVRLGGVTAYATNGLEINKVTADFNGRIKVNNSSGYYAGAVGVAAGSGLDVDIIGSSNLHPVFTDISTTASQSPAYFSGAIGYVGGSSDQDINFASSTLGLTYNKTGNANRASLFGCAIGSVANCAYAKDSRKINLSTITTDLTVTGATARDREIGGILGVDWYAADATLNGVTVNSNITAAGDADFGGLVHAATGRWDVKQIALTSAGYNLSSASDSTFGFIANKTSVNGDNKSALYLDVDNTGSNYNIAALTFTGGPTFSVYDEIVAYSGFNNASNIVSNGHSIISITTSNDIINTNNTYNTYLNKTTYGQTAANKINPKTRYYYNVNNAREIAGDDTEEDYNKYNFYVWSLKTYAHNSLAAWFPSTNTFTGDLDMTGISYYPVDLTESVTFGDGSTATVIKLDNVLMEDNVKYAYTGADGRTTRSNTNQHYLMHTALFRNDGGSNITLNKVSLQGNVPNLSTNDSSFCGFIVAGTLGNSEDYNVKFNGSDITLDGVHIVTSTGADLTTNAYAPLLINKIGKKSSLTLDGVAQSMTAYSTYASGNKYAASSLIGDVGSSSARAIYLSFADMKLDGRSAANSIGNMDTAYGTDRSIFSRATFLNSFLYAGESSGSYNYEISEDWTDSSPTATAIHNVTYGKEISTSAEFANKQKKYINNTDYFTHPTSYQSTTEYDFSTGFLPHVYVAYNLSESKHEIAVNVSVTAEIQGCGKYNDPYIIDDDSKLPIISKIIHGGAGVADTTTLYLPDDLASILNNSSSYTATGYIKYKFSSKVSSSQFIDAGNATTQTAYTYDKVREYLAGAYYVITKDIKLDKDYIGLGETISNDNDNQKKFVFRGVIIGRNITVTNESVNPLIHTSVGSVIKDLTVKVDVKNGLSENTNYISLAAPTGSNTYEYLSGIKAYGAVIGQILGGDNIIDNVETVFTNVHFDITGSDNTTNYERLTPIGGYVGALVNGGLIFRNMVKTNNDQTTTVFKGLTSSFEARIAADSGYLYINPIIGRVIAGYAFYETNDATYSVKSTLDNGNKNYVISDLTANDTYLASKGKLTITYSSTGYTIEVPDGQAMYLLGAIINSGAAAANDQTYAINPNSEKAYYALLEFWQAYRSNTTVRGGSYYTTVGSSTGTDYTSAQDDRYTTDRKCIPYIIRKYTINKKTENGVTSNSSIYYARYLGKAQYNIINVTGDCDVAAGFRGIGDIFYNNELVRLRISQMNGGNHTITLHMRYIDYDQTAQKYIAVDGSGDNDTASSSTSGFGLFNVLFMDGVSKENSTNSINSFTLNGSIYYDVLQLKTGNASLYRYTKAVDGVGSYSTLNVGGVIGTLHGDYYLKDLTINNIVFEGAKFVGGLIGYARSNDNAIRVIDDCGTGESTTGINITAGVSAGGLVGFMQRRVTIKGDTTSPTKLLINSINVKGKITNDITQLQYLKAKDVYSVGGIIGTTDPKFEAEISNYRIVGKSGNTKHLYVSEEAASTHGGGVIGTIKNTWITLTNISIENLNIEATYAGGLVGSHYCDKQYKSNVSYNNNCAIWTIENCTVDGNTGNGSGKSTIKGYLSAGGITGEMNQYNTQTLAGYAKLVINNTTVKNYKITSSTTDNNDKQAAGGVIGLAVGGQNDDTMIFDLSLQDLLIDKCAISTAATGTGTNSTNGTGGLFGTIKFTIIKGHNILINETSIVGDENTANYTATVIGNNRYDNSTDKKSFVKLVGVSANLTGATTATTKSKVVGNTSSETDKVDVNDGYVVFADYGGVNTITNTTHHVVKNDNTSIRKAEDDEKQPVDAASPYVTVNPYYLSTSNKFELSSDGVADTKEHLPIQTILTDGRTGRYKYAADSDYTGSGGDKNLTVVDNNKTKFAMLSTEVSYFGPDFPVLVLDGTETNDDIDKLITAYIRMLTNTKFAYGDTAANTDKYDILIYRMVYDGQGGFTPYLTETSLKRNTDYSNNATTSKFYRDKTLFDSGKEQFTLIDVRFYDPGNNANTAYHLYIPVFVKKVLQYRFDIAALSGTSYYQNLYSSRYGEPLIENAGTPVTVYFQYAYTRTAADWKDAIEAGENIATNYSKTLVLDKANTNAVIKDLVVKDSNDVIIHDAILVLVDPNDNCKPYYAKFSDAFNTDTRILDLSAFKETMTADGQGGYTFSGDSFTPQALSQLLNITATQNNASGLFVIDDEDPTVKVGNTGYRLATDSNEDAGADKYNLNVTAVNNERYYLSIYTEADTNYDLFHYYIIKSPSQFSDANLAPAKITDTQGHTMAHLIMGKIFDHSDFKITSYSNDLLNPNPIMTDTNNILNFNMSARIGLADELGTLKSEIKDQVTATNVYQSFVVYLNRKENDELSKVILGSPSGVGTYYIDYTLDEIKAGDGQAYGVIRITQNYAEFVTGDISSCFEADAQTGEIRDFEINSELTLTYSSSAIPTQFPGRSSTAGNDNGVTVSGSSNIAFQPAATTYSKNTVGDDESPARSYYSESSPETATLDLSPVGNREGDFTPLGINALNIDGASIASFDILPTLNVGVISGYLLSNPSIPFDSETNSYNYTDAIVKIELRQKQADGTYGTPIDMRSYMDSFGFEGCTTGLSYDNTAGAYAYTQIIPKAQLEETASSITLPVMKCSVITGDRFEDAGYTYGNFKITVTVYLRDANDEKISITQASNYVIYTNAKVLTDFINQTQQ